MQDIPLKTITRNIRGITMTSRSCPSSPAEATPIAVTLPYWNEHTPEDVIYDEYIRCQANQKKSEEYQRQYKLKCKQGILRNKPRYNTYDSDSFIDY